MNIYFKSMVSGPLLTFGILILTMTIMDLVGNGFELYGFLVLTGLIFLVISKIIDDEVDSIK